MHDASLTSTALGGTDGAEPPPAAVQTRTNHLRASQRRVLQALSWSDGLTRTALAVQLGMPKATVTGLVDSLIARGLVLEKPATSSRGKAGRPAKMLTATGPSPTVGVVVFSTGHLWAAVVTYAGTVLGRASAPFANPEKNPESLGTAIELLHRALAEADEKERADAAAVAGGDGRTVGAVDRQALADLGLPAGGPTAIVLGIPAPFQAKLGLTSFEALNDQRGRPSSDVPAYMNWVNGRVISELSRVFGVPAMVENDANLGAIGEATFGAGRGIDSFVFLKLARGVGAGLVVGRRLHRGQTGFAGELSHVHVRDDGPLCPCGGRGCLAGILGDAIVQSVQPAYERPLTLRDVIDLAASGEPGPRRVLGDVGRTMGRPLADFATLLNPGAIIVDGSFAPAVDYLVDGIRESIDRYAAPVAAAAISVIPGALGEDAELLGAAVLARAKQAEGSLQGRQDLS